MKLYRSAPAFGKTRMMKKMNKPLHITIPITKIDEDQRMVYGYATVEEIDSQGEIITYDASKKAFNGWIGNIREMHQDKAVGKALDIEYDDDKKGVWIGAKISESEDGENAWIKVKEGVLAGFSIGGRINNAEVRTMSVDGKKKAVSVVTDYDLGETSLVDKPSCPSAIFQMIKSEKGNLIHEEKLSAGVGRPVHWWERMYKFSDSQDIMKASFMAYNKNSMAEKSNSLAKNLWDGVMLADLAMCLSDYIFWKIYEGEDVEDLKEALAVIQEAAASEISEPEQFPEMEMAIENAAKALNITKREELVKMAKDLKEVKKTVVGQEDRDADGNVVPPADDVPPTPDDKVDDSDDKPESGKAEGQDVKAGGDKKSDAGEEAEDKDGKGGKGKKADSAEFTKQAESDLAKSILAGVEVLIEKSVAPLKEEIDNLKRQPAPSKVKSTYSVKKGEDVVDGNPDPDKDDSQEGNLKKEFDTLLKRADELAKDASVGTPDERIEVAFKLRKLSRQLDPASQAKHNAVRATFRQK